VYNTGMIKTEIIKSLPLLSKEDLEEIETNIFFMLKPNRKEYLNDREVSLLYGYITSYLEAMTGEKAIPYNLFIKKTSEANITKLCTTRSFLNSFIETALAKEGVKPTLNNKARLYSLFTKLLYQFLKSRNIKINIVTMLSFNERFPSELNSAFPGYVENSILSKIVGDL
jgi:hypothetical protein